MKKSFQLRNKSGSEENIICPFCHKPGFTSESINDHANSCIESNTSNENKNGSSGSNSGYSGHSSNVLNNLYSTESDHVEKTSASTTIFSHSRSNDDNIDLPSLKNTLENVLDHFHGNSLQHHNGNSSDNSNSNSNSNSNCIANNNHHSTEKIANNLLLNNFDFEEMVEMHKERKNFMDRLYNPKINYKRSRNNITKTLDSKSLHLDQVTSELENRTNKSKDKDNSNPTSLLSLKQKRKLSSLNLYPNNFEILYHIPNQPQTTDSLNLTPPTMESSISRISNEIPFISTNEIYSRLHTSLQTIVSVSNIELPLNQFKPCYSPNELSRRDFVGIHYEDPDKILSWKEAYILFWQGNENVINTVYQHKIRSIHCPNHLLNSINDNDINLDKGSSKSDHLTKTLDSKICDFIPWPERQCPQTSNLDSSPNLSSNRSERIKKVWEFLWDIIHDDIYNEVIQTISLDTTHCLNDEEPNDNSNCNNNTAIDSTAQLINNSIDTFDKDESDRTNEIFTNIRTCRQQQPIVLSTNPIIKPSILTTQNPLLQYAVSKIPDNVGCARVVRIDGCTIRDGIDIDNSNTIIRCLHEEVVYFDDIQILPAVVDDEETIPVNRLHVYYVCPGGIIIHGWASEQGRLKDDHDLMMDILYHPNKGNQTKNSNNNSNNNTTTIQTQSKPWSGSYSTTMLPTSSISTTNHTTNHYTSNYNNNNNHNSNMPIPYQIHRMSRDNTSTSSDPSIPSLENHTVISKSSHYPISNQSAMTKPISTVLPSTLINNICPVCEESYQNLFLLAHSNVSRNAMNMMEYETFKKHHFSECMRMIVF